MATRVIVEVVYDDNMTFAQRQDLAQIWADTEGPKSRENVASILVMAIDWPPMPANNIAWASDSV